MGLSPNTKIPLCVLQMATQLPEQKCRAILAAFLIDREKAIRPIVDQVSEKLWVIENGQIKEFFGNFSEYLEK